MSDDSPGLTGDGDGWSRLCAGRASMLSAFAAVVGTALQRRDTEHRGFHGCLDWHSAVHGTYALFAIARLTGDATHRDLALHATGGARDIDAETAVLRAGHLAHEVPYGAAWVLHLDLEARRAGIPAFNELADVAALLVADHLRDSAPDASAARSPAYRSAIWATSALLAWASRCGQGPRLATAEESARRILAARPRGDRRAPGFFSPEHLTAVLALQCGLRGAAAEPYARPVERTAPLTRARIRTAHEGGLNFSRSWGCYAAWLMTGRPHHRADYVRLLTTHFALPALWRDDYDAFAHWVPQFGTFALAMTDPIWFTSADGT
ncbi:hypothetical protein ABIE67_007400 [Streptomyces sp. V4I8]|uniref:DUF2891 family protein n=1 Tax=Streptomyces sp. V4I8 TaxID=3156469 RepID=UPI003517A5DC